MENIKKGKIKTIVIIILSVLLLSTCAFICYDNFLKKEVLPSKRECDCPECEECQKCENEPSQCECPNTNLGYKVNSIKEVKITDVNQTIKIGKESYKIKFGTYDDDEGYLSVDDYIANYSIGDGKVIFDHAYLTDKFMLFTVVGQDGELINYVLGEKGDIVPNNNNYQMSNFKIVDGYLHASGHIFCGLDESCPDKDLLIKYIDNTLIVTEFK